MGVFVLGLPRGIRQRLRVEADRNETALGFALVEFNKFGTLAFIPFEGQAVADLNAFCDDVPWSDILVLVLPYVQIGQELQDTIDIIRSGGGLVLTPDLSRPEWPPVLANGRYVGAFNERLYTAIIGQLGWLGVAPPSSRFERSARRFPDYIIMPGALDRCDEVHSSRFRFLLASAEGLEEFCRKRGEIGVTLASFFEKKGIEVAQSGGITTVLRLIENGKQLGAAYKSQMHLKQGDATTPQAAASIYFQHIDKDGHFKLILMYVGPHPDQDIERTIPWPI